MNQIWFTILLLLAGCVASHSIDEPQLQTFTQVDYASQTLGCGNLMSDYCTKLYSPEASGNLLIDRAKPIRILQGETKNQFSQTFYKYAEAKLKNRRRFPKDLLEVLNKYSYFENLDEFLHRRPINYMSFDERVRSNYLNYQLGAIWESSINETIMHRMALKFKGFHQIPPKLVPIEYDVEERRLHRKLISEVSKIIWSQDANWKKVIDEFADLKETFYLLFKRLDIPDALAEEWRQKISSLELVLPGSLPEISDDECSTTNANAYYYKYLNIITVCAGDFNSEDILLTLAHEMSHALGIDRNLYVFLKQSKFGQASLDLRKDVCGNLRDFDCKKWDSFKSSLPNSLAEIKKYSVPLPAFNRCLRRGETTKSIEENDIQRISEKIVKDRIASLANADIFLRLIKEKIPLSNGRMQKNSNYFNPCSYYLWTKNEEPVDDNLYTLIYFAAQYKCSDGEPAAKFKAAIDEARKLSVQVEATVLRAEGEFSDRPEINSEGLGSAPFERFADVLGTYAVAEKIKKYSSLWERRSKFLATSSWLCEEPSVQTHFPEESKIESDYSLDTHSQGEARKMEILSEPVRSALSCQKDFEFKECQLPFKK